MKISDLRIFETLTHDEINIAEPPKYVGYMIFPGSVLGVAVTRMPSRFHRAMGRLILGLQWVSK